MLVEREDVGCASDSGGGTVDDKVWENDERDAVESSPQPGRRLTGGKATGQKKTGRTEKFNINYCIILSKSKHKQKSITLKYNTP